LDEESWTAAFLLKIDRDFKQTMVEVNIWGAFSAIGFIHDIDQIPYGLLFNKKKFRQSPGFVEFSEGNMLRENLSKRRRESKFGWTNKSE
jgi:hypothetical protein